MEITERQAGDIGVLAILGDIDLETSPQLRAALKGKGVPPAGGSKLVLDFSQVGYIDSSGLATLIEHYQNIRGTGGKLALAGLSKRVRNAFELVRLNEIFPIYANLEEALQAVRAEPPPE